MTTETSSRAIVQPKLEQTIPTAKSQSQLLFFVSKDPEGGYIAKAPKYSIYTQGETWEEMIENIREAILCHFEEGEAPPSFELQTVSREVILV